MIVQSSLQTYWAVDTSIDGKALYYLLPSDYMRSLLFCPPTTHKILSATFSTWQQRSNCILKEKSTFLWRKSPHFQRADEEFQLHEQLYSFKQAGHTSARAVPNPTLGTDFMMQVLTTGTMRKHPLRTAAVHSMVFDSPHPTPCANNLQSASHLGSEMDNCSSLVFVHPELSKLHRVL